MSDHRERLILAREAMDISRAKMADKLMTPIATYKQWESGDRRTPGVAVVAAEMLAERRPTGTITTRILALENGRRTNRQIATLAGSTTDTVRSVLRRNGKHAKPVFGE